MKVLFFIVSIIGFFVPYFLQLSLQSTNEELKLLSINLLPYFNFIYFGLVIVFFFLGLKKVFARYAQIIFIVIYLSFTFINYYFISKLKVSHFLKQHPNGKIVKITNLKNIKDFKLLFKSGPYAVIEIVKRNHSLPFNYKKDRRE